MSLKHKKNFVALSLGALLLITSGTSAHAAADGDLTTVAGLCSHHTEHTAECIAQTPCSHSHTQDCYNISARCIHVHSDACRGKNSIYGNCTHICTEANGCITRELACCHEHDEDCRYAEESVCNYTCDSCHETKQSSGQTGNCRPARRSGHHGSHHSGRHHC